MTQTTPQHLTIPIIILLAIVASLVPFRPAPSFPSLCPPQIMPSCTTRGSQEAVRCRLENEAMAAATLQKEKDATTTNGLKATNEDNFNVAVNTNLPPMPLPLVVSPPLAPNLTSLLTDHVG
jgi:hypothetical protein